MNTWVTPPIPLGGLGHRNTSTGLQHGPVSLLGHAQLRHHERECQASSGTAHSRAWCGLANGKPHPAQDTRVAARALATGENFQYVLNGKPHPAQDTRVAARALATGE